MLAYADQGNSYRQTAHIQMFAVLGLPALLLDKCETCKRAPRKSPPAYLLRIQYVKNNKSTSTFGLAT